MLAAVLVGDEAGDVGVGLGEGGVEGRGHGGLRRVPLTMAHPPRERARRAWYHRGPVLTPAIVVLAALAGGRRRGGSDGRTPSRP